MEGPTENRHVKRLNCHSASLPNQNGLANAKAFCLSHRPPFSVKPYLRTVGQSLCQDQQRRGFEKVLVMTEEFCGPESTLLMEEPAGCS